MTKFKNWLVRLLHIDSTGQKELGKKEVRFMDFVEAIEKWKTSKQSDNFWFCVLHGGCCEGNQR